MELSCWGGDWGLPSLHPESLTVMVTGGAHCPAREGGRERRRRPGICLPPARTSAGLLLASGEAGGGRRGAGPAARAWLLPHGRGGRCCRPSRGLRALPGGTAALPAGCRASALHSLSCIRAMKLDRSPSRTCWRLVLSARRGLAQLLKLSYAFLTHCDRFSPLPSNLYCRLTPNFLVLPWQWIL